MLQRSCWLTKTRGFSPPLGLCCLTVDRVTKKLKRNFLLIERRRLSEIFGWQQTEKVTYSKEPKSVTAFNLFTFFRADFVQSEASWKLSSTSDWFMFAWKNVNLLKEVTLLGSLVKAIRTISNFTDLIQFHSIWQILGKISLGPYISLSKFRKRSRQFFYCVHLLHKAGSWN